MGEGRADQKCLPLLPETAPYSVASVPRGAIITYIDDERELIAPENFTPIINSEQTIVAAPYNAGKTFSHWSDGIKEISRTFTVSVEPKTFKAIYVNQTPRASVSVTKANARGLYKLDASRSADPEGETLRFSWSFPDGSRRSGPVVTKRFARPGIYRVVLTVRDRFGAMGGKILRIVVKTPGRAPKA